MVYLWERSLTGGVKARDRRGIASDVKSDTENSKSKNG